jgi:hypothetical protein
MLHAAQGGLVETINHQLVQLTKGGRYIGTFREPGSQIDALERLLDERVVTPPSRLSPRNSRLEEKAQALPDELAAGYLVIERVS